MTFNIDVCLYKTVKVKSWMFCRNITMSNKVASLLLLRIKRYFVTWSLLCHVSSSRGIAQNTTINAIILENKKNHRNIRSNHLASNRHSCDILASSTKLLLRESTDISPSAVQNVHVGCAFVKLRRSTSSSSIPDLSFPLHFEILRERSILKLRFRFRWHRYTRRIHQAGGNLCESFLKYTLVTRTHIKRANVTIHMVTPKIIPGKNNIKSEQQYHKPEWIESMVVATLVDIGKNNMAIFVILNILHSVKDKH